ncbi:MAG: hypothetical protein L6416_06235 [Candidatus Omnitrophica bacterium]|nr:hypothetical protein [Candidatus Omnitrophota bacterium]
MRYSTILLIIAILLISTASFGYKQFKNQPLMLYLFSSSTCEECELLKNNFLPEILEKFKGAVEFEHIAVNESDSFALQLLYEQKYNNERDDAIKIFVGEQCLAGSRDIRANLERIIQEELSNGSKTVTPKEILEKENNLQATGKLIERKFLRFNFAVVGLAGLVDGINPCAFVTIIFFISMLSLLKKTKREVLIIGSLFSLSVFLTYLLIGIGALKVIKIFSVNYGIARFVAFAAVVMAFILAFFNFLDFLRYRLSNNPSDIRLKLPENIRLRINRLISSKMRFGHMVFGTILLGVSVSLLESICTGQVYLPTIIYILQGRKMFIKSLSYLLLYNFMFIVPLLVVFAITYAGVNSKKISAIFTRNIASVKLLLAILFLILGLVLISGIK